MEAKTVPVHRRNEKVGEVASRAGDKTIVVKVSRRVQHPVYKKFINKSKKFYAHDEKNECQVGDRVRIAESRPLSRLKRWRLEQIIFRPPVPVTKEQARPAPREEAAS